MPLKGWMNRSDSKNMNLGKGKVVPKYFVY